MSDPNQSTPKTKIITEVHGQAAPAAPDTDNVRTYIPGLAAQRSVGRMLIESGPSAGSSRPVYDGTNPIGRDAAQNRVALDVEDSYISRTGHAILNVDVARKAMSSGTIFGDSFRSKFSWPSICPLTSITRTFAADVAGFCSRRSSVKK